MKQPNAVKLGKKNNKILPFEDESALEFLGHKNDASLFMLGTSNKKRPDNIVMGRLFDFHVLDMVEFGVLNLRPASAFKAAAPGVGMRPCFVFCGDEFEQNPTMKRLGNMFLDFFGGRATNMVNLRGLENVIVLTSVDGVVHFRHYSVSLQKSSERVPRVELEEVGPSFEMRVGRSKLATEEQWKQSTVADPRVKVFIRKEGEAIFKHKKTLFFFFFFVFTRTLPSLAKMWLSTLWDQRWVLFMLESRISLVWC